MRYRFSSRIDKEDFAATRLAQKIRNRSRHAKAQHTAPRSTGAGARPPYFTRICKNWVDLRIADPQVPRYLKCNGSHREPVFDPAPALPIFLDTHHGSELAPERIREFLRAARRATRDAFGVHPLDLYCGDDGRIFFVVAAPDEASVRQQHAAQGVICRRVRRVESSRPSVEDLGDEEKMIVRHMIAAEHAWPARAAS